MINRHLIKNFIYIISIGIITLIVTAIMINVCAQWHQNEPLNYLTNPANFYEVELCKESLDIVSKSLYVNASILGFIGFFQIIQATILASDNPKLKKDNQQLALAGRVLLVISICMIILMRIAYVTI
ncbi:hypothetical protein KJ855_02345 [Patescibacteria group bacterium]|nr:hypothetical protein [Patescibacteria group bacterium]